jgi:hypothetical protein
MAEAMVSSILDFHSSCSNPELVLWLQTADAKGGALEHARKVFHECKVLLAVATAAKIIFIRGPADDWESPKQKREAIQRVQKMIASTAMGISKAHLHYLFLWSVS